MTLMTPSALLASIDDLRQFAEAGLKVVNENPSAFEVGPKPGMSVEHNLLLNLLNLAERQIHSRQIQSIAARSLK